MKNKKNVKKKSKLNEKKDFDFFKLCMKYPECKLCPMNGKGRCKDVNSFNHINQCSFNYAFICCS